MSLARSLASQSGQAVACRSLARSLAFQSGRTLSKVVILFDCPSDFKISVIAC
jgi:hypothetical protein